MYRMGMRSRLHTGYVWTQLSVYTPCGLIVAPKAWIVKKDHPIFQ